MDVVDLSPVDASAREDLQTLERLAVPGSKGAWILVRDAAKVALPENAPKPAERPAAAGPAWLNS